jgi:hypothetical protein
VVRAVRDKQPEPDGNNSAAMSREQKFYDALKRITKYASPEWLRSNSERYAGLDYVQALEMAYENMQEEARAAVHRIRRPKV